MEIDSRLRPIAKRPVDTKDPNWTTLLGRGPHPLDEAGVRAATEALLEALVEEYQKCDRETRRAIRELYAKYTSFAWAATLPVDPTTNENFRCHVVLFSINDQGQDSRDAIVTLQDVCGRAKAAGVVTGPILQQAAQLSSDDDKYGMGSTKSMLLNAV